MAMNFSIQLIMLPVALFMFLLPIALLVALQVWLCRKGKWLGLILPGVSLALSLLLTLSMAAFGVVGGHTIAGGANRVEPDGQEIPTQIDDYSATIQTFVMDRGTVIAVSSVFLVTNIPTIVFGGIWLHYKGRSDTLEDLKRMRIEDLE